MVSEKVTVTNKTGLHARPASELMNAASKCKSDVIIRYKEKDINPKSIIMLLAATIGCGSEIEVICDGDTEIEDLETILTAIKSGLGEQV